MKEVVFLLGAGVSQAVGMPSTKELTDLIFNGTNIKYDNSHFQLFTEVQSSQALKESEKFRNILFLLEKIKEESNLRKEINYEDLFYVITQMREYQIETNSNPCVRTFYYIMKEKCKDKLIDNTLCMVVKLAYQYINEVVYQKINIPTPGDISNLVLFENIYNDTRVSHINIFTLNHDLVLEKYFDEKNINYIDGFKHNNSTWNFDRYKSINDEKISIAKLHGSINWFIKNNSESHFEIKDVKSQLDQLPVFLTGTDNKFMAYYNSVYFQLAYLFHKKLWQTDTLIVSGYSFGDNGINQRLTEWIQLDNKRKMIVIAPNIDELKNNAGNPINTRWEKWEKDGKIIPISEGIENVLWENISTNYS